MVGIYKICVYYVFFIPKVLNLILLNELKKSLLKLKSEQIEIPMYIGSKKVKTGKLGIINPPHEKMHILAKYHIGDKNNVQQAFTEALKAKSSWENLPWENRVNIFLKAADLFASYNKF